MSKHEECGAVGKFDCPADETIYGTTLDSGDGEGDTAAPCAWFCEVTLEDECEGHEHDPSVPTSVAGESMLCDGRCQPDYALAQHYGTRWLIARENSNGTFWVECYDTEEARDERLEGLRQAYAEWDTDVLS